MASITKKKKKQQHTSPRKTTTTTSVNTSPTRGNKKKHIRTVPDKMSIEPKKLWAVQPTSPILLKFIEETFIYKGLNPEKFLSMISSNIMTI